MVAFVLDDARMESVGLALDRPALRIEARVAQARVAAAPGRAGPAPTGSLPSPPPSRRTSGVSTGLTSSV